MMFVYILRCSDGTLYVGHTADLKSRENLHNAGLATAYTAARRPVKIVYSECCDTRAAAMVRESQIKRWSGQKKQALIDGDTGTLKTLSKRRRR
jgi:predicted GIY-YIG superfamily endonuclease